MLPHPRRPARLLCAAAVLLAVLLAGCGADPGGSRLGRETVGIASGRAAGPTTAPAEPSAAAAVPRARGGHAWFPLVPGHYVDYRILRFTVDEPTYVRVTVGLPERFFARVATPLVYGPVPGRPVDEALDGLRQYYSVAPDGALWFHGAQNQGFMSHTEPPVRQLPAEPVAGAAWSDTVFFESFFPGGIPFFSATQTYDFTLSEPAFLDLPAGPVHALRAGVVIDEVSARGAAIASAALEDGNLAPFATEPVAPDGAAPVVAARGRRERPGPPAIKGPWFARQRGLVARDYPAGPGPGNINITTYERLGEGFGPLPAAAGMP